MYTGIEVDTGLTAVFETGVDLGGKTDMPALKQAGRPLRLTGRVGIGTVSVEAGFQGKEISSAGSRG